MARKHQKAVYWFNSIPRRTYLAALGITFGVFWLVLAIAPVSRSTWLLENVAMVPVVASLALFYRKLLLSRMSYTLIFIFLCLHEIGAHYTYVRVPYDDWFRAVFGTSFNELVGWERNNYDRVVHFLYGLLFAYPIREVFLRVASAKGFWGYFLPLDLTMSSSMLFELLEWATAVAFGDGATDYVGTQGDVWDAHKDMALASLGALIAMGITAFINWHYQRDFNREWLDSLKVKNHQALGEEEVARALKRNAK